MKIVEQNKLKAESTKTFNAKSTIDEKTELSNNLKKLTGVDHKRITHALIDQASHSINLSEDLEKGRLACAFLRELGPKRDLLDGMLCVQMISVHNLAMEFVQCSLLKGQTTEGVTLNIERANKLMRTFTLQLEALNRHRGKGQQKITVEHISINSGAQAIIASDIATGGSGGTFNE